MAKIIERWSRDMSLNKLKIIAVSSVVALFASCGIQHSQVFDNEKNVQEGFSLTKEASSQLEALSKAPATALYTTSGATAGSIGLFLHIIALADALEVSKLQDVSDEALENRNYRAFYADTSWYKDFQALTPSKKREAIQRMAGVLRENRKQRNAKKLDVVITWIGGGSGHKSAMQGVSALLNEFPDLFNVVDYGIDTPTQLEFDNDWANMMKNGDAPGLWRVTNGLDPKANVKLLKGLAYKTFEHEVDKILNKLDGRSPDVMISVHNARSINYFEKMGAFFGSELRIIPTDYDYRHFFIPLRSAADKVRVDVPAIMDPKSPVERHMAGFDIEGRLPTGYAVRRPFSEMSELLAEGKVSQVEEGVDTYIKSIASTYEPKRDKTLFTMLGGQSNKKQVLDYIEAFGKNYNQGAISSIGKDGKLHMFVACKPGDVEFLQNALKKLRANGKIVDASKYEVHILGKVDAEAVANLMRRSINIVKPGGGTVGELVAVQGKALFDMSISKSLKWETGHAEWFERNGWGAKLSTKKPQKTDDLAFKVTNLLTSEPKVAYPKGQFNLDWVAQMLYQTAYRYQKGTPEGITPEFIERTQQTFSSDLRWTDDMRRKIDLILTSPVSDRKLTKHILTAGGYFIVPASIAAAITWYFTRSKSDATEASNVRND